MSLIELLLALAITAMLLTATAAALDASFRAYADAAGQASTHAATRIVTNRLLTLLRTSTAHGPLHEDAASTPAATLSGNTIVSPYIELIDPSSNLLRIDYEASSQTLWLTLTPAGTATARPRQPLLTGVTACQFTLLRRENREGLWVLQRGTMDLTVMPGTDATLSIESGHSQAIRVIASTMPRKIE